MHRKMQYNKIPIVMQYGPNLFGNTKKKKKKKQRKQNKTKQQQQQKKNVHFEKTKLLSDESLKGTLVYLYAYGLQWWQNVDFFLNWGRFLSGDHVCL